MAKFFLFVALAALLFVGSVAASQILLSAEEESGTLAWTSTDGTPLGRIRIGNLPHEILATPDGKTAWVSNFGLHDYNLAIGYAGYFLSEIDVVNMAERRKLYLFAPGSINGTVQRAPHGLKLSPDGKSLWINTEFNANGVTPALLRFDLTTTSQMPAQVVALPATVNKIHNFVFSSDGLSLWLQLGAQGVAKFDIATSAISTPFCPALHGACAVRGLVIGPDGRMIISGGGELFAYDIASGVYPPTRTQVYWDPSWMVGQFFYANISPDGKKLVVPSNNGNVFVIDYVTGALIKRVDVFGLDPVMAVITGDSKTAFAGAARGSALTKINLDTFETTNFPTPINAGPNGLVLVNQPTEGVHAYRETFNVVVVTSLSQPGGLAALPIGYQVKSCFDMWKEQVNLAGGIVLADGNALQVSVTYVDDFLNTTNTNAAVAATLQARGPISTIFNADSVTHAVFVANVAWTGPNAAVQAQMQRRTNRNVPVISVFAFAAASKRSVDGEAEAEADEVAELHAVASRQFIGRAGIGYDRWVDTTQFNTEYYTRFQRYPVAADGQAMVSGLVLQDAIYNSGVYNNNPGLIQAIGSTNMVYFYAPVTFDAATGTNNNPGYNFPVFVNAQIPNIAAAAA